MKPKSALFAFVIVSSAIAVACGSSDSGGGEGEGSGGSSGAAGSGGGSGGSSGTGGAGGNSGSGGSSGTGGAGGNSGSAGTGGADAGDDGNAGTGGAAGIDASTDGGSGGAAGSDGGSEASADGSTDADASSQDGSTPDACVDGGVQTILRLEAIADVNGGGQPLLGSSSGFGDDSVLPFPIVGSADGCVAIAIEPPTCPSSAIGGDAGTVTVTGANDPISFVPSGSLPNVLYKTNYGGSITPEFDAGATLTFTTAGGPDIGAFSGSVVGPAPIAGYTPPASISRGAGLTVSLTAATSDSFGIVLIASDPAPPGNSQWLLCQASDSGSFTITSKALSLLSSSYTNGLLYLQRENWSTVSAGSWTIKLGARQGDKANVPIGP
jgi:hypothetical protein